MTRKIQLFVALLLMFATTSHAQKQCWEINPETKGIEMLLSDETIQLPTEWDEMALRKIKAFGGDFDIEVKRTSPTKAQVLIKNGNKQKKYSIKIGEELKNITL